MCCVCLERKVICNGLTSEHICCYTCDLDTRNTMFEWSAANRHVFSSKGEDGLEVYVLAMARVPLHGLAMFGLLFGLAIYEAF